jgi:hypothetical protein
VPAIFDSHTIAHGGSQSTNSGVFEEYKFRRIRDGTDFGQLVHRYSAGAALF